MVGPQIKICGIKTAEALDAAIAARADHVGLNFHPASPRYVSAGDTAALAARAGGRIGVVGLFVDADDGVIADAVAARLTALQLHGSEEPRRCAELAGRHGLPVWKVIPVASPGDVARADRYAQAANLILFDAKTPAGTLPGGMGLAFDWELVANWKGALPWGLAGGLSPANVAEAIRITRAPLVDTASGVESASGVKDPAMIAAFCKAARGA